MITKEQAFGMYIHRKNQFILQCGKEYDGIKLKQDYKFMALCLVETELEDINPYNDKPHISINNCKLILRPFESMEDNEMSRFNSYYKTELDTPNYYKLIPNSIEYLISIGIDIFNLKERGWAVYERDIK